MKRQINGEQDECVLEIGEDDVEQADSEVKCWPKQKNEYEQQSQAYNELNANEPTQR